MDTLRKSLISFFDLLFPPDIRVSVFDSISQTELERYAVHTPQHRICDCIAPLPYKKPLVRYAVHAMKYHGHARAAELLGEVLAPYVAEELADERMFGNFLDALLIPIPLHKKRLHERGFNQTERIASALCRCLESGNITLELGLLERTRYTESQARSTSKKARLANMKSAFTAPNPEHIAEHDIILLDDVITTGATLAVAQETLYKAGARNVLCIAVAH